MRHDSESSMTACSMTRALLATARPLLAGACALLVLAGAAQGGNWPTIGGNSARNGQSADIGPTGPDLLWEGSVSSWFGGQVFIENDRLVTMRFQGINVAPIVCCDLATGSQEWAVDFPGTNSRSVPRGFRDGRIYATNFQETGRDTLYALSAADGSRLWVSQVFCERGITWGAVFAPNGDPIVPAVSNHIARVDHLTGAQMWDASRIIPNTGAETLCVFGNTVYGFEGSLTTPKMLTAWDVNTGQKKYSSAGLPGDGDQEVPFSVAPDGTIYVQRDGGFLYALTDTGSGIVEKWHVHVTGTPTYGQFGIGLDGSVYIPDGTTLVRLDPQNGAVVDRSAALVTSSVLNARVTVGADGNLYVGNGGSTDGALYAFSPSLQTLWSQAIPSITYAGPALGTGGALAVAGSGNLLKVYRSSSVDVATGPGSGGTGRTGAAGMALRVIASPNPFRERTRITFRNIDPIAAAGTAGAGPAWSDPVRLTVCDPAGRIVRELGFRGASCTGVFWDGKDALGRPVQAGTYFVRLQAGRFTESEKIQRIR